MKTKTEKVLAAIIALLTEAFIWAVSDAGALTIAGPFATPRPGETFKDRRNCLWKVFCYRLYMHVFIVWLLKCTEKVATFLGCLNNKFLNRRKREVSTRQKNVYTVCFVWWWRESQIPAVEEKPCQLRFSFIVMQLTTGASFPWINFVFRRHRKTSVLLFFSSFVSSIRGASDVSVKKNRPACNKNQ